MLTANDPVVFTASVAQQRETWLNRQNPGNQANASRGKTRI